MALLRLGLAWFYLHGVWQWEWKRHAASGWIVNFFDWMNNNIKVMSTPPSLPPNLLCKAHPCHLSCSVSALDPPVCLQATAESLLALLVTKCDCLLPSACRQCVSQDVAFDCGCKSCKSDTDTEYQWAQQHGRLVISKTFWSKLYPEDYLCIFFIILFSCELWRVVSVSACQPFSVHIENAGLQPALLTKA